MTVLLIIIFPPVTFECFNFKINFKLLHIDKTQQIKVIKHITLRYYTYSSFSIKNSVLNLKKKEKKLSTSKIAKTHNKSWLLNFASISLFWKKKCPHRNHQFSSSYMCIFLFSASRKLKKKIKC